MKKGIWLALGLAAMAHNASAQEPGYADAYLGAASIGSGEPMFRYDDQERWKHGWVRAMPFYEGFHSFRPYNYHHVFSQSQTAAGWGMPPVMPYSQQFWHRYEEMADLTRGDHTPVAPYERPPQEWDHYPKPLSPGNQGPGPGAPSYVPNTWTPDLNRSVPPSASLNPGTVRPIHNASPAPAADGLPYLPAPY